MRAGSDIPTGGNASTMWRILETETHGPVRTHEAYLADIRDLVLPNAPSGLRARLAEAKLVYGAGLGQGYRGVTVYGAWKNGRAHELIEIAAACEESDTQLAGTTIHELGHVLAGHGAGHGKEWKAACHTLGLITAEAAGQSYHADHFETHLWGRIQSLPVPTDGTPVLRDIHG